MRSLIIALTVLLSACGSEPQPPEQFKEALETARLYCFLKTGDRREFTERHCPLIFRQSGLTQPEIEKMEDALFTPREQVEQWWAHHGKTAQ